MSTGNVLVITSEYEGDVVKATKEQDMSTYYTTEELENMAKQNA